MGKRFLILIIWIFALLWIFSACLQTQWISRIYSRSMGEPQKYISDLIQGQAQPPPSFPITLIPRIAFEWTLCIICVLVYFLFKNYKFNILAKLKHYIGRHQKWLIITIIILGFSLRISWLIYANPESWSDATDYRRLGWKLATGQLYQSHNNPTFRPPGYPFLLSLSYQLGLKRDLGARLVDTSVGVAFPIILGLIAWLLAGRKAGLLTLLVTMINPITICYSGNSLSEIPYCLFFYAALLLFLLATLKLRGWIGTSAWLGGGLCLGYAALIKPLALLALFPIICYVVYSSKKEIRSYLIPSLLILIGSLIVIFPWSVRNYKTLHRVVPISTNGGEIFYSANTIKAPWKGGGYNEEGHSFLRNIEPDPVSRDRLALKWILSNKSIFIRSFPYRFLRLFENYNYACHRWFAIIRKAIPWQITSSLFSTFLLVPIFLIIRSKYIVISLQKSAEMKLIGGLYIFYFLVILLFETYSRSNFPYSFLLLLLIICSSGEKQNTGGLENLHGR
jgi:Dolichyl-phosphate-mannose-protein mannosyltransferase